MLYKSLTLVVCAFLLSSCVSHQVEGKLVLTKSTYKDLQGWDEDNHPEGLTSFKNSCAKIKTNPQIFKPMPGVAGGTSRDWLRVCSKINSAKDAKTFFENNFTPYLASKGENKNALFTGYFEIELNGSKEKKVPYIYPVYKLPPDFKAGEKYYTRSEINQGILNGKNLEIAWVDDPVRLFFMHVQGSGIIKLDDGRVMRVGFAGKNNQEYVSIGKYIAEVTSVNPKEISKNKIEDWLKANPAKINHVLEKNPSYIFFREIGTDGPIGGQGVALTPMRSAAIDASIINYSTPIWVDSTLMGNQEAGPVFRKLLIAQDTGSAIKGPLRLDIFFGYGEEAEKMAGYQNNPGRYFLLLPKD